jgi:hypothetical protein
MNRFEETRVEGWWEFRDRKLEAKVTGRGQKQQSNIPGFLISPGI